MWRHSFPHSLYGAIDRMRDCRASVATRRPSIADGAGSGQGLLVGVQVALFYRAGHFAYDLFRLQRIEVLVIALAHSFPAQLHMHAGEDAMAFEGAPGSFRWAAVCTPRGPAGMSGFPQRRHIAAHAGDA